MENARVGIRKHASDLGLKFVLVLSAAKRKKMLQPNILHESSAFALV